MGLATPLMQQLAGRPPRPVAASNVVLRRLRSLGPCSPELTKRVMALGERVERFEARTILQREEDASARPRYLLEGWACRVCHLPDGRRQLFDVVLPGDDIGVCRRPHAVAAATIALTPVVLGDAAGLAGADAAGALPGYAALLEASADAGERRLLSALLRLGRLSALERLAHFLLELHNRLTVVELATADGFPMPLTQEALADAMGLSVVHVNRTLQELRRQRLVALARGRVQLQDREGLAALAIAEGCG